MAKINSLLTERLKTATEKFSSKMSGLAELTSKGNLSSFSGVFRVKKLSEDQQQLLKEILINFGEEEDIDRDLPLLCDITSELKAINNQAAILHGERIKKAQDLLKKYKEGAFSAWLIATYGNRQTPYNFLQYYELYIAVSELLKERMEQMPKQAVYTLASRRADISLKKEFIAGYKGEAKQELLKQIRTLFPLDEKDKRRQDLPEFLITSLKKCLIQLNNRPFRPTELQKKDLKKLLLSLREIIDG